MTALDDFAAAIRHMESGGNYKAMGVPTNYGRATGAYQFIDSTWGNYGGYRTAAEAPPEVQDAKAHQLMQSYFDYVRKQAPQLSETQAWGAVAMGWMGGRGAMDNYIKHGASLSYDPYSKMSPDDYARRVMSYMGHTPSGPSATSANPAGGTAGAPAQSNATYTDWVGENVPDLFDALFNRPAMTTLEAPTNG